MENKKTVTPFNEKALAVLDEIEKKYKLEESEEEMTEIIEGKKLFKINIVASLAEDLVLEKISNKEFIEGLHKELKTSPETTKGIAIDVMDKLIPLLKPFSQEELKNYRSEKEPIIEEPPTRNAAQDLILAKINKSTPPKKVESPAPAQKLPYSKKVEIPNVEENAKNMQKSEALQKARTVIPQQTNQPKTSGPDTYREPIE